MVVELEPEAKSTEPSTLDSRAAVVINTGQTSLLTFSKLTSSTSLSIRLPNTPSISSVTRLSCLLTQFVRRVARDTMAPPCPSINAPELPVKIQQDGQGKKRKLEAGKKDIDLSACELFEMLQYKCEVQRPLTRESPVRCFAVDRTFRRWVFHRINFSSSHGEKPTHWYLGLLQFTLILTYHLYIQVQGQERCFYGRDDFVAPGRLW